MNVEPLNKPAPPSGATGPRTEAGKAISSQNARKHDLCSRSLRLSPEEWAEYNDMRERYGRDFQPADDVEETLIDEICFNYWRLQQAREAELQIILEHPTELPIIALYIRYRTGYERAFYKALDQIQKRQLQRCKQANSVRSAEPEPQSMQKLSEEFGSSMLDGSVGSGPSLEPLPIPGGHIDGLDEFVSQNPAGLPKTLLELLKKVA